MSDSKNNNASTNELDCVDCGAAIPPLEVYACDQDCRSAPLCASCYEDNHAEGGCLDAEATTDDGPPLSPDDLDTSADRLDQADMAWAEDAGEGA